MRLSFLTDKHFRMFDKQVNYEVRKTFLFLIVCIYTSTNKTPIRPIKDILESLSLSNIVQGVLAQTHDFKCQ